MYPGQSRTFPGSVPVGNGGGTGLLDRLFSGGGGAGGDTPLADARIRDILTRALGIDPLQASRVPGYGDSAGGQNVSRGTYPAVDMPQGGPPGGNLAMMGIGPGGPPMSPSGGLPPPAPRQGDAQYIQADVYAGAAPGAENAPNGLMDRLKQGQMRGQPMRGPVPQTVPTTKNRFG